MSQPRGTVRDDDQREYGAIAAGAFDEVIVREDKNLRGRPAGETATNVLEGIRGARAAGTSRATRSEKILDEMTAVRAALPAIERATDAIAAAFVRGGRLNVYSEPWRVER